MSVSTSMELDNAGHVELLGQVLQQWNNNNPDEAIEILGPVAARGEGWANALISWLYMQLGLPSYEKAIEYAIRASELGLPSQVYSMSNAVIPQLPQHPELADRLRELVASGSGPNYVNDSVGQGWNLASQGHTELGLQVMKTVSGDPLTATVLLARERLTEISRLAAEVAQDRNAVAADARAATEAMKKSVGDLETSASQAGLLVTSTTSEATNALYKADAKRNEEESRIAWLWGLRVLGVAAAVAILPLASHYVGKGPEYSMAALVGAHAASTVALASFAGVLLARARSRDLASQRANDLSTAMGTMLTYSRQIKDPVEQERFMMTMGQLVLQAHLTSGAGHNGADDSLSGVLALASLIKPSASPTTGQ